MLVTDVRVARHGHVRRARLQGALAPVRTVTLAGRGDRDKSLATVKRLWDTALAAQIDRDAMLVGVGGGVVTDLAGFAAATLLRGVRYASAPTTLLAMVDASVGGKTGFDHPRGKNLIGAFHQPSLVVCDPTAVATQSPRDVRAGLAEIAKVAIACDRTLFDALADPTHAARLAAGQLDAIAHVLPGAIQAKIDVVARDERETGERAVLNFGHTVGHALEQGSGYALPHGECVAVGMRAALWLGTRVGVTPEPVAREAHAMLDALGLPRSVPPRSVDPGKARRALALDKKRRGTELRFVLCAEVGASVVRPVGVADALAALDSVLETRAIRSRRVR